MTSEWSCHNKVERSTSVSKNVTVPVGKVAISAVSPSNVPTTWSVHRTSRPQHPPPGGHPTDIGPAHRAGAIKDDVRRHRVGCSTTSTSNTLAASVHSAPRTTTKPVAHAADVRPLDRAHHQRHAHRPATHSHPRAGHCNRHAPADRNNL